MGVSFTAFEIFEIAEQIEKNGVKFYTKASELCKDQATKDFFLELAEMEKSHIGIFEEMRKEPDTKSRDTVVFDPDNEIGYYLKAMASNAGWEGQADPGVEFRGNETPEEIIKSALKAEKASINYYLGLKDFVVSEPGKKKIEEIIKEEMSHAAQLQKKLEQLG